MQQKTINKFGKRKYFGTENIYLCKDDRPMVSLKSCIVVISAKNFRKKCIFTILIFLYIFSYPLTKEHQHKAIHKFGKENVLTQTRFIYPKTSDGDTTELRTL